MAHDTILTSYQFPHDDNDAKKAVPAWVISLIVHCLVLVLMSLIVAASTDAVFEEPAIKTMVLPQHEKIEEKITEHVVTPITTPMEFVDEAEQPNPITDMEVTDVKPSSEDDNPADQAKGDPKDLASSEMGDPGVFVAIGPGGGASGLLGNRGPGGKKRAVVDGGGGKGTEDAVDASLRWFKKHQSPNGMWDIDGYPANCTQAPKCEPGTEHTGDDGDVAGTGYAILCYLGAGYDHRLPSTYKTTVKKGLDWLVSVQNPDGLFPGGRNYEQGVATMALAEAYAMSNDPALKGPAQKAIDVLLARQAQDKTSGYGLGWDYVSPNPARNDGSVSGWCVMALKSGAAGDLNIGNGMNGATQYLERAWKDANKNFTAKDPYTDISVFPYAWNAQTGTVDGHTNLAPVGALMAAFLHHKAEDPMLNSLINFIMKNQFPTTYPCNTYYLYYNTLAIFQAGGKERWTKWNTAFSTMLLNAQRKSDDCFNGSWDFEGTAFHGHKTGRILSTAYCCLSLQVYYRYKRMERD